MCSPSCFIGTSLQIAKGVNVSSIPMHRRPLFSRFRCYLCDEDNAMYKCRECRVVVYCSPCCLFNDFERHDGECTRGSPALKLFQNFERRFSTCLRIKWTADPNVGWGVVARRKIKPGERLMEDTIIALSDPTNKAILVNYLKRVYDNKARALFSVDQVMTMTKSLYSFWIMFINHSCIPNTTVRASSCGKFLLLTAIRTIEKDDQITLAYIPDCYAPLPIRAQRLTFHLGEPCKCDACVHPLDSIERCKEYIWSIMAYRQKAELAPCLLNLSIMTDKDIVKQTGAFVGMARLIAGETAKYAEPWLAVFEHYIAGYIENCYKVKRGRALKQAARSMRAQAVETSHLLGFCRDTLIITET